MAFERVAEQRIRQAMEEGEFDNLPNAGQSLDLEDYFAWPESVRMAYALLKSANCVPVEVELLREIARLDAALAAARDEAVRQSVGRTLAARRAELEIKLAHLRQRR